MSGRSAVAARATAWVAAGVLVVLCSHVLVYALAPRPGLIGTKLEYQAGGPRLAVLALVALGIAISLSGTLIAVASVGVAERSRLEPRAPAPRRISVVRVGATAAVLWCSTCVSFALLESYLHWRAGLGWHGLHCLVGPIHRDAVPILGALSVVAAALVAVLGHLVAWMRRVVGALAGRLSCPRRAKAVSTAACPFLLPRSRRGETRLGPRGPPWQISTSSGGA